MAATSSFPLPLPPQLHSLCSPNNNTIHSPLLTCSFPAKKPKHLSFHFAKLKPRLHVTSALVLPTKLTLDEIPAEKLPQWSARAVKTFTLAQAETRKIKYPETGTETLLMGILFEGSSDASKFLRANGINFLNVQEETMKLLGKSAALFGVPEYPSLTDPAQKALDWAVQYKLKSGGDGEITVTHLLLGLWAQEESAAHRILATLGFNDEKAKELLKYLDKDIIVPPK